MSAKPSRLRFFHREISINAFFILILGAVIIAAMWINAEYNANKMSKTLIEEIKTSVISQTTGFFMPAKALNRNLAVLLYDHFDDPVIKPAARQAMYNYFRELMSVYPAFKMIYYSDSHGNQEMLSRMSDDSFSKRSVRNEGNQITHTWEHENSNWLDKYINTSEPVMSGYDPRRMGWYGIAQTTRTITWTSAYLFNDTNLPGITCVAPIYDSHEKLTGVVCIDIAVNELSNLLGTIMPAPGTKLFILDNQNNIMALQARSENDLDMLFIQNEDKQGHTTFNISSASAFPDENSRYLLEKILENPPVKKPLLQSSFFQNGKESITIKYNRKKYLTSLAPIAAGDGLDLKLCVIIPKDDILWNIRRNTIIIAVSFYLIFAIAVIIGHKRKPKTEKEPKIILSENPQPLPEPAPKEVIPEANEDIIAGYIKELTKTYKVKMIVSGNTIKILSDTFENRLLDRIFITEKNEAVNIYELISLKGGISENQKKLYEYYETGLAHYFNQEWQSGFKYFSAVLKYLPNDAPAKLMQERCFKYRINPPPQDWNGTVTSF